MRSQSTPEKSRRGTPEIPTFVLLCFLFTLPADSSPDLHPRLHSFPRRAGDRGREQVKAFLPDEERRQHHIFTAEPQSQAPNATNELARYIADEWRQEGLEDVVIRRYDVYGSNPKFTSLEMARPFTTAPACARCRARRSLHEDKSISSAWSGMSASGDVTAPLVYAHSGKSRRTYELLRKQGIDVKGKSSWCVTRIHTAIADSKSAHRRARGAAAVLIYSDPAEDGFKKGQSRSQRPVGSEYHIQRGAITYDFMVPAIPLTPGWASVPGAKRISVEEATSIPKIMALHSPGTMPSRCFSHMEAPVALITGRADCRSVSPRRQSVRVHVKIEMDNSTQPYYVGGRPHSCAQLPDEWIVSHHRDAWVFGGVDPSSGTASMMEVARALGKLAKTGTRPRRTVRVLQLGRRRGRPDRFHRVGRAVRRRPAQKGGRLTSMSIPQLLVRTSRPGSGVIAPMARRNSSHAAGSFGGKTLYEAWRVSTARERREAKQAEEVTDSNQPTPVLVAAPTIPCSSISWHARHRLAVRRTLRASTTQPTTIFSG